MKRVNCLDCDDQFQSSPCVYYQPTVAIIDISGLIRILPLEYLVPLMINCFIVRSYFFLSGNYKKFFLGYGFLATWHLSFCCHFPFFFCPTYWTSDDFPLISIFENIWQNRHFLDENKIVAYFILAHFILGLVDF